MLQINRVSAELSHENIARESSNVLKAKKIWPTRLAAGIWIYTVAYPMPAGAPEALARAQLLDNMCHDESVSLFLCMISHLGYKTMITAFS